MVNYQINANHIVTTGTTDRGEHEQGRTHMNKGISKSQHERVYTTKSQQEQGQVYVTECQQERHTR